jgi:curved DNA-binding protein CbpA
MMTKQVSDPYRVLGIARDADDPQIRDAYRRSAKRYHPDLHPDARTSERMGQVNEAWHVLSDPARRARYDMEHPAGGSPSSGEWRGASRREGPAASSARPSPPAWAPAATGSGTDSQPAGWGASHWTARSAPVRRPSVDLGATTGPPWVAVLAILAVGWLVIGGLFGGLLLPPGIGVLALLAVFWILGRLD